MTVMKEHGTSKRPRPGRSKAQARHTRLEVKASDDKSSAAERIRIIVT